MICRFAAALLLATVAAAPALAKPGQESVLHAFNGADGASPVSPLIADEAGNLYGTTFDGGSHNSGTVFRISPDGTFTMLYDFAGDASDGAVLSGPIAMDANGAIYGTARYGGTQDGGIVYKLAPPVSGEQWQLNILYSFCAGLRCADGKYPDSGVVMDRRGALYGTTGIGGAQNSGIVYRLEPPAAEGGSWHETVLHDFCGSPQCSDGYYPGSTALLLTKDSMLYGTTTKSYPQTSGGGVLFRIGKAGRGFTVLHSFPSDGTDGLDPDGGLAMDKDGTLYGATGAGGAHGCGTAYSLNTFSSAFNAFYSFCSNVDGVEEPGSGLTLVKSKNGTAIYGVSTFGGGDENNGVLFSLKPPAPGGSQWHEKVLYRFCSVAPNCADGRRPISGVLLRRGGEFIGSATADGPGGQGVIYSFGKR